jgi:hypothetical protein
MDEILDQGKPVCTNWSHAALNVMLYQNLKQQISTGAHQIFIL